MKPCKNCPHLLADWSRCIGCPLENPKSDQKEEKDKANWGLLQKTLTESVCPILDWSRTLLIPF